MLFRGHEYQICLPVVKAVMIEVVYNLVIRAVCNLAVHPDPEFLALDDFLSVCISDSVSVFYVPVICGDSGFVVFVDYCEVIVL